MAKYQGRSVKLGKPFRTPGQSKKFAVFVRDRKTKNVKKVRGQKTLSPAYWSLFAWRNKIR